MTTRPEGAARPPGGCHPIRVRDVARDALTLLRARPVSHLALGSAVTVSLLSVCCGIGLLTTPRFTCELLAMQLGQLRGQPVPRAGGWLGAAAIQACAVLPVSLLLMLALFGGELASADGTVGAAMLKRGGAYGAILVMVSLAWLLPFLYAPMFALERRTGPFRALVASAGAVRRGGTGAHLFICFVAHMVQAAPPLLALLFAHLLGVPGEMPRVVLLSLPALALTVPLGQGMLCAAYLRAEPARALAIPEPPALRIAWGVPLSAPLLALLGLAFALLRPAPLVPVGPPEPMASPLVQWHAASDGPRTLPIMDTGLRVAVAPERVAVEAGDGGGVGTLPLPPGSAVAGVEVARVGDAYRVRLVLEGATGPRQAVIDRAGVRLDDGLGRRLLSRVPGWALLACLGAMALIGLLALPGLAGIATGGAHAVPAAARRRSLWLALCLCPATAWLLYWGVVAAVSHGGWAG